MNSRTLRAAFLIGVSTGLCACVGGATALEPVVDSAPRIIPLVGTAPISTYYIMPWAERATLYLPEGWHADATGWFNLQPFTFDADGVGHPTCRLSACTLTLDPSDGCAHYHYDHSEFLLGDQLFLVDGNLVACDDGGAPSLPTATLTAIVPTSDRIGLVAPLPTSAIAAMTDTPVGTSTAALAVLRVDGAPAAATVTATSSQITLAPQLSLRIGAAVSVSLTGVEDVMGRAFAEPVALQTRTTTDVVTDLTFGVAPPDGAVSAGGASMTVTAGALCLGGRFSGCITPSHYPLGVALALADPGSSTSLSLVAVPDFDIPVFAAVARADGTTGTAVELPAPGADVPIPAGAGPIWLLFYAVEQADDRCPSGPERPSICIDSITIH